METIEYDISPFKYTKHSDFCLLESAAMVFGLVPVFVSALPGAREPGSRMWRHLRSFCVYWECVRRIVYVSRIILECTLYYYFVSIIGLYIE